MYVLFIFIYSNSYIYGYFINIFKLILHMKNIKIKSKKYAIKYSVRALFLYEQITQRPFTLASLEYVLDRYLFAYCIVLASNKDCTLDWDEFVEAADDDPKILEQINSMIIEQQKLNEKINNMQDEKTDDSKKD